ncbi:Contactin-associated protein 1 [Acropora cervicornis]|uniref:Contactin-associated protein 1 n=1 Tax=Acropora cervicornis TaxID=6130 RepID=A0AAD9VC07_ACRCE|nr:Contactin-associated protein 1 [Acropora cervicornis]
MKSVAFELVSLFSLAEMTSAWLQKLPYKLENGFLAYGSFSPFYYHSLTTKKIITSSPEDKLDCGFACIAEPKCVSFNIAANADSNDLFLCELLDTDIRSLHVSIIAVTVEALVFLNTKITPIDANVNQDLLEFIVNVKIKSYSPKALSGSYAIDPDGEGGCEPIIVFCNMTENYGIGVTVIGHDSEDRMLVKGYSGQGRYAKAVHYSGVSSSCISQLANLTVVSSHCEQFIKYECHHSVILYNGNPYGWWVSRDGVKMKYWGGAGPEDSYKCACGVTKQCADRSDGCNCDKNDVIELRFGDTDASNEKGYHTLGKLKCYGII